MQSYEFRRFILLCLVVVFSAYVAPLRASSVEDYLLRGFKVGGDFVLTNQLGNETRLSDLRGKVVLVFFGFTNCPDVCPTTMVDMSTVLNGLGERAKTVRVVFISVDPIRDTPEHLKNYIPFFHKDIIGLTGSEDEIAAVAEKFDSQYRRQPLGEGDVYSVEHSSFVFLLDQEGLVRYVFPYTIGPATIIDGVSALLAQQ
jgi:protein SCO1/2